MREEKPPESGALSSFTSIKAPRPRKPRGNSSPALAMPGFVLGRPGKSICQIDDRMDGIRFGDSYARRLAVGAWVYTTSGKHEMAGRSELVEGNILPTLNKSCSHEESWAMAATGVFDDHDMSSWSQFRRLQ
jgi:hypothetical protein